MTEPDGFLAEVEAARADADASDEPERHRVPLADLQQQERQVARCLKLAISKFLGAPSESMGRTISGLSAELRLLREGATVEVRLQALEEKLAR